MLRYNVRGENVEVTTPIKEYAENKISKLERYFANIPDANVYVNLKTYPKDGNKKVEVTVPLKGLTLRAEEINADLYAAIDLVVDKLERQVRKHKTKVNRKHRERHTTDFDLISSLDVAEDMTEEIKFIRTKEVDLKPMDKEEAVLQMDLLGHDFFIYTDADTNQINIVYRRKDGRFGLIETK